MSVKRKVIYSNIKSLGYIRIQKFNKLSYFGKIVAVRDSIEKLENDKRNNT